MACDAIRPGFQSVIPYLSVRGAERLVKFLEAAFAAKQTFRAEDGRHLEVQIGDSKIMIGEIGEGTAKTAQLFMYVQDADAQYQLALKSGATAFMPPADREWGEGDEILRGAGITDPCGSIWYFAGPK